ncbi:hypothetical protein [Xanthomonas arboricola]|uniref:hypothetical protein n=1 Tax=Xanthomonas arboricola TaxID=56448 RepID=UPI0011B04A0B|nr:hypothetical protein [Xanthomonas arboricola]MBB3846926.1 hypothetical protein [Xanthomonas arboricola]
MQKKLRVYVEQAKNRFLSQFEDVTEKQSGREAAKVAVDAFFVNRLASSKSKPAADSALS